MTRTAKIQSKITWRQERLARTTNAWAIRTLTDDIAALQFELANPGIEYANPFINAGA